MTELEKELRAKFGFPQDQASDPAKVFQELGAFWWHWNLHRRQCDKTDKNIISVFRPDCPYPVWDKDVWTEKADPPFLHCHPDLSGSSSEGTFCFDESFFEQLSKLWQRSPIPHNFQSKNQNCEYTDDWYSSKNCYLCHSGQDNEDCRYCYGCDHLQDCYWSIFSFDSELCVDLINCKRCYHSLYLLNCQQVRDSAFCYDCRDCTDCLFSFNLRNKQYCFGNQQLTKEEYEAKKAEWDFTNQDTYNKAKAHFADMMPTLAWHRALLIDKCEETTGNFLGNCRKVESCYMLTKHEDCVNVMFSGPNAKTILNALGTIGTELCYMTTLPVYSYQVSLSFGLNNAKFCDYSAFLQNCEHCFGCCGLFDKKYHIFNKPYSEEEYFKKRTQIIDHLKKTGEWGQFFPGSFAPSPYDESLAGHYFPMDKAAQEAAGYWYSENLNTKKPHHVDALEAEFCAKLGLAESDSYYMHRIRENLKLLNFTGSLRQTKCAKSGITIETSWPEAYDGRILCEAEYLKIIR